MSAAPFTNLGTKFPNNPAAGISGSLYPSTYKSYIDEKFGNPRSGSRNKLSSVGTADFSPWYTVFAANVASFPSANFSSLGTYTNKVLDSDNESKNTNSKIEVHLKDYENQLF